MSDRISPQFTTIDGSRVRYAASGASAEGRRQALLLSPWPESVYAFEQAWDRLSEHADLTKPHVVGPDIGTSSALFAAATRPNRFASLVIGSGGAAVPIEVTGVLKEWVEAPDLEPYGQIGGGTIVALALGTIDGYEPSDEIHDDYVESYRGDRFADTIPYAQSYREQLPVLAELLTHIDVPVRIVAGAGHFCWEETPAEYAALVTDWWQRCA